MLIFGLWWTYFVIPFGALLEGRRERSFGWGYGHIPLYGSLVAVGAGLHVAAYHLGAEYDVGLVATVVAVAVPIGGYVLMLYLLYAQVTRTLDPFHLLLLAGVSMVWCVLVLAATPWVTVIGYETVGHRHNERVLGALG